MEIKISGITDPIKIEEATSPVLDLLCGVDGFLDGNTQKIYSLRVGKLRIPGFYTLYGGSLWTMTGEEVTKEFLNNCYKS